MKHLLTVVLCAVSLVMIAVNVYAGTDIGGSFGFIYRMLDDEDQTYANLNFKGTVNEKTNAYLTMSISGTSASGTPHVIKADSFYIIDKESYGTFTVGSFYYGTNNLYILGGAFNLLQSNIGIKFEYPCLECLTLKAAYFHQEEYDSRVKNTYDAYALGCDYKFEKCFIGLNFIQPGVAPGATETAGYTLNVTVDLNPASKIYLHYGQDKDKNPQGIIGYYTRFPKIPFLLAVECGFIPMANNYIANNYNYGAFLNYQFAKNVAARYTYTAEGLTSTRSDLVVAFYF
ncbi:MAG TPA: hypothetical protein VHY08_27010 [Bacillota bacterium]|nr:hypothetical protein [Bacillota bacterium]